MDLIPHVFRFAASLRYSEYKSYANSSAVPGSDVQTSAQIVSGKFDFTGEGQIWSRYEAIKVDRDKLIRTESNPTASFTYAKCS